MLTRCVVLCAALWLVISGSSHATNQGYDVITAKVGDSAELLVINLADRSSHWYVVGGDGGNRMLGSDLAGFQFIAELAANSDYQYLAVISVGEGHPLLEIIDLRLLLEQGVYQALHELNPYPGDFELQGWQGHTLEFASTAELDYDGSARSSSSEPLTEAIQYQFDVVSGRLSQRP
ncbi:hypothetical protein [Pseudidiomarina mangrovi]|uniref:hypothetical protein n=1 Tax=Pseudidiomarina mangrovi TaxID=2487133 RepID=UPI000FCA7E24|nr:hypothetical protein [Pseudidiomarina mangrovi]